MRGGFSYTTPAHATWSPPNRRMARPAEARTLYELRLADAKAGKAIGKLPKLKRPEEIHA